MKKFVIVIAMTAICSALFAQQVFIDGQITSNFETITPRIGLGVAFNKADIFAGVNFRSANGKAEYESVYSVNDYTRNNSSFGVYGGVAPKAVLTEKLNLRFPLLAHFQWWDEETKYENSTRRVTSGELKTNDSFRVIIDAGTDLSYSFNTRWEVFAGFAFDVFMYTTYDNEYWRSTLQSDSTFSRKETVTHWFNSGYINLGVKFKF